MDRYELVTGVEPEPPTAETKAPQALHTTPRWFQSFQKSMLSWTLPEWFRRLGTEPEVMWY